jgi:hypothetical protein
MKHMDDEPNLCSIELIAEGGSMVIDQSLDITLRGELNAAMKAARFPFPESKNTEPIELNGIVLQPGESTTYGLNREFIKGMTQFCFSDGRFSAHGEKDGITVKFKANKASVDIGHLINAIRLEGGASWIEKGLVKRYGK